MGLYMPIPRNTGYDTLCTIIRQEDDLPAEEKESKYGTAGRLKLHTTRLLVDGKHPTQTIRDQETAQLVSLGLAEWHGAEFYVRGSSTQIIQHLHEYGMRSEFRW